MCGIFVVISGAKNLQPKDKILFDEVLNVLTHRGPDACDSRILKTNQEDGFNVYLGHRRLSIIDLDPKSNQPFEADNYQIVFNGEVYNYLELRKELEADFTFKTNSDTEVILRYYQKYGTSGFGKFNGMWSLVIYDPIKNNIVVARDRFSVKPLYQIEDNGVLYFASEIKALKKLGLTLTPNTLAIERLLSQQLLDVDDQTFYNEIKIFPPMSFMELDLKSNTRTIKKYWDFTAPVLEKTFGDRKEVFRELLLDSLKLRMRSDVPLGTLLSGGLDSSAITTLIHEHLNDQIQSFSVVSDEKKYSEESFVDLLVKNKNISNRKLRFVPDEALDNIKNVLDVQDEPYGSLGVVAQYLLFEKIKKETDITVLLSGQGADEVLLGYNKFYFFYLKELKQKHHYLKLMGAIGSSFAKGTVVRQFSWKHAKRYLPGSTNKGRKFFKRDLHKDKIWSYDSMTERQILDINNYSVPHLTHYEDRNSMAHQLEVRLPFLDYRLVNYLVHLPVEDKLKSGWTKYLLRESVHELPNEIRWRKDKQGFVTPEEKWLKGAFGEYIISYFSQSSKLEDMGILDRKEFVEAVKSFRTHSKWLVYGDIFTVFITEMWLRENFA
ncbi:MAG: asparagine synthase (glutamine-hydrolyzing) [Crocinitomicaceae bacterium]|nr:asparagine synthase (glutamine-hydrolyzing) [Crocinitomicaceae bacterium]